MINRFKKFIDNEMLFNESDSILLGVSGGIDSMAMLELFAGLFNRFAIAHCNFNLRGEESDQDQKFIEQYASEKNYELYIESFDTKDYALMNDISIQMAARELRYNWFDELSKKHQFDYIAIAHNSDDVIETFFINLTRGTGIKGLTGIKSKYGNIIRPLLFASRTEIEEFVDEYNIPYREDSSNQHTKYSRNKIRHLVIPELEKINPRFKATMIENIDRLKNAEKIYNAEIEKEIPAIVNYTDKKTIISIDKLVQKEFTKDILLNILIPYGFSIAQVNDIQQSMHSQSGKRFLSSSHKLIKDRNTFILTARKKELTDRYYIEEDDQEIENPVPLELKVFRKNDYQLKPDNSIAALDYDQLSFPLMLRKWKQGDYFMPLGMQNLKKVSDFFIDQKFSLVEKEETWILVSGDKIVWIVGSRIDDRFKVTNYTSKILELKLTGD